MFSSVGYTGVYNVLDYSCMSFPTGFTVDAQVDKAPSDYKPMTDLDATIQSECKSWDGGHLAILC